MQHVATMADGAWAEPCAAWRSGLSRCLSRYDDDSDDDDDDNDGDDGDDEHGDHVTDDDDDDYDDDYDVLCLPQVVMLVAIFEQVAAINGFSPNVGHCFQ